MQLSHRHCSAPEGPITGRHWIAKCTKLTRASKTFLSTVIIEKQVLGQPLVVIKANTNKRVLRCFWNESRVWDKQMHPRLGSSVVSGHKTAECQTNRRRRVRKRQLLSWPLAVCVAWLRRLCSSRPTVTRCRTCSSSRRRADPPWSPHAISTMPATAKSHCRSCFYRQFSGPGKAMSPVYLSVWQDNHFWTKWPLV